MESSFHSSSLMPGSTGAIPSCLPISKRMYRSMRLSSDGRRRGKRVSQLAIDRFDAFVFRVPERLRFHSIEIRARIAETGPHLLLGREKALFLAAGADVQDFRGARAPEQRFEPASLHPLLDRPDTLLQIRNHRTIAVEAVSGDGHHVLVGT